jgi:hypothetical protein
MAGYTLAATGAVIAALGLGGLAMTRRRTASPGGGQR